MPRSESWLPVRRADRQALLDRTIDVLVADQRVVAAWLTGSLGRGVADDLSDLDLWVVIQDEQMASIAADPAAFARQIAQPLLIQEAPWNAPADGAYLLVLYPGQAGPQQVDWYWQPQAHARVPLDARVLFDHSGVAKAVVAAASLDQAARRAAELVMTFWAMSFITAKKIARGEVWTAVKMLSTMQLELDELRAILEDRWDGTPYRDPRAGELPATRRQQLEWLRDTVETMRPLMATVARWGGDVPTAAFNDIEHFFDLVETLLDDPAGA